ncbi:MAG TPA: hypothetical protein VM686_37605, partial [Polyangiaceae bacterium]|nr:hypothetical protein [Polyangiaceae bacterium]
SAPVTVAEPPRAAAPSRTPAGPAPAAVSPPAPGAGAVGTSAAEPAKLADSFKTALSETADTIAVTVHISPSDAAVFKDRQRLGQGEVTVNVARGTKITLVAQLDGHTPRTLVLDGSYNSVNIVLSRAEATRVKTTSSPAKPPKAVSTGGEAPSAASGPAGFNPYD